jgi:methyl-accepting chemotaxis protein
MLEILYYFSILYIDNKTKKTYKKRKATMKFSVINTLPRQDESQTLVNENTFTTTTSGVVGTNAVDTVSELLKAINTIAAQTTFLAINAAIEAAHAGESGKGVSTLAREAQNLAESTARNSKAISGSLKNIMAQMQNAKDSTQVFSLATA